MHKATRSGWTWNKARTLDKPKKEARVYLRNPMDPPDLVEQDEGVTGIAEQLRAKMAPSSTQYNYNKLRNEKDNKQYVRQQQHQPVQNHAAAHPGPDGNKKAVPSRPPPPRQSSKPKASESNSSSSHKDAPLIDLSTDVSDVTSSSTGDRGGSQQQFLPSGIDIFDTLSPAAATSSSSSQYCNLGARVLPRPIFGDVDPDPFDVRTPVAAAIAAPLLQSLSQKRRIEAAGENPNTQETPAPAAVGFAHFGTRDDSHLSGSSGVQRRGHARSLSPPPTSALRTLTLHDSPLRSDLFNAHAQTTGVPVGLAVRAPSAGTQQSSNPFREPLEPTKGGPRPSEKNEHAFDWLEEALRGKLSSPSKGLHKPMDKFYAKNSDKPSSVLKPSNNFVSVQENIPKEQNSASSLRLQNNQREIASHPMYDEVPVEEEDSRNTFAVGSTSNQAAYRFQLASDSQPVSHAVTTNNIQLHNQNLAALGDSSVSDANYGQYALSSNYSDIWGSEFNDDDYLDDQSEIIDITDFNVDPSGPPPIPPRTYHEEESQPRGRPSQTHILPMVQHGVQQSHTHYFCLPSVNTNSHYRNFTGGGSQQAGKVTAAVKPYHSDQHQGAFMSSSSEDYENAERERSSVASTQGSLGSRWSGRSSSASSSPRLHQHDGQGQFLSRASAPHSARSSGRGGVLPSQQGSTSRTHLDNPPPDLVGYVLQEVIGVTEDECRAALSLARWDAQTAVQYLKVEQLFRLGVSSRSTCRELLERLDWNLELAGSVLADRARAREAVQCESAV
ncbi:activated CDC42 kinase 1 [Elysia marginata]|uniref:Activated CDC42 kinase 1 n=1 Tax=Elysia marginata TaxID=1093978 RepID=A0AAV4FZ86_9GAST|nr:activated CDC42 kinase 1 [Elysia marginata]